VTFPADDRATSINVQGVLGPRFLGNEQEEFDRKRTGASAGFAHLNVGFTHERGFPGDVRLKLAFNGQLSDGPMISNEQFGFGGASSVRGYLESEQFVDNGFSGQFEILSADWGKALYDDASARLAFFTDVGLGNLNDPLPEQDDRFFLWSVGLGLRATLWDGFNASLDWAVPLKDTADGDIEGGDSRVHFSTGVSF
jgi:hemolysin activation/secretion protein